MSLDTVATVEEQVLGRNRFDRHEALSADALCNTSVSFKTKASALYPDDAGTEFFRAHTHHLG